MLTSLERRHYTQLALQEWGGMLTLLGGGVSTQIIWNSSAQEICIFSLLLVYLVIYLYQCELMDIYFVLWVIIQHYSVLFKRHLVLSSLVYQHFPKSLLRQSHSVGFVNRQSSVSGGMSSGVIVVGKY